MKDAKVKIQPLGDRIVVEELKLEEKAKKTASGIFIPESEDKGAKQGRVVAVGKGKYDDGKLVPLETKIGDVVLFQWGDKVTQDGKEYFIVTESSVLAIMK